MRSAIVLLAIIYNVGADPIFIRSGVGNHKDEARNQDAKTFDLNTSKGVSEFKGQQGFNQDNEGKHVQAQDAGKYNQANSQKNVNSNEKNFADNKFHQAQGGEESDFNKKSANKKGSHKSGFTKSFHKDESGSSSSYYDDSDDEGNEFVKNNKKNLYGDSGHDVNKGLAVDNRRYSQDQGKQGYFNNAGNYDRNAATNRGYHSRKYYDDHENEGRRNLADRFNEGRRYGDERYLKKSGYDHSDPYYYESKPRQTITIYEDPRYDGYDDRYPGSYDSDYVHLELKRPPRDYDYRDYYRHDHDRRPYDYYW